MHTTRARTSFAVSLGGSGPVETIAGARHAWRFRPHFHAGDEVVQVLTGRARLRLPDACREVAAGDTVVVPAGVIHRFEPVDGSGWAFSSRFVPPTANDAATPGCRDALGARAMALLAGRPSLRTDVEAIAQACAVSVGHLARAFRRATGSSLHNFHLLLALHEAKARLRHHASIVEAALDAGFYDQAHLNREFVRTFGLTPAAFRAGWARVA
ncbi:MULTISPECIES: helix-turn-helix transcriptional regulator [Rhodanobacter]|uniref:helix-turn-helix transcriptional regulator n=1 Tax=Rhodanobacter TaxID=75309 RepID=UPI0002610306|nr:MULTISPECIES: AraC family transcriptional regulator [Rhodanobacter]EIM01447.1 AraC family transcriptional regulator [Rhodanobacter denitrificans]KZC19203.1 AraC family transcriptional regulator [Rhodanobacter denitrificans]UJJ49862.1 AraC family transcriptional regulator [Rhodanobacter denitrificans]UJM91819.1 AraC family transcriptional regulator [Rhodanobacter denitrificans]UJM92575.1 AraC family transcriptional regulator [Rhodanobacter denitrificans]